MNIILNDLMKSDYFPSYVELKESLTPTFPLINQFKDTPQDPEWHAEGDVDIHTEMVINELYKILKITPIEGPRRLQVILGTFLHDIAKPLNTKEFELNGITRVGAKNHEYAGMNYLAYRISQLQISDDSKIAIMELVSEHGTPKGLVKHERDKYHYIDMNCRCDTELVYLLELSDWRGRIANDLAYHEELMEYFKMFCIEYDCWGPKKKPTYSNHSEKYTSGYAMYWLRTNQICMDSEALSKNFKYHDNYSNFVMMCGIAGAGKSTLIQNKYKEYEVISLDEIRKVYKKTNDKSRGLVINEAQDRLRSALRERRNVIFDATNIRKDTRKKWIDIAIAYGALVTVELVLGDINTIIADDQSREGYVGRDAIWSQYNSFQYPDDANIHYLNINFRT